MVWKTNFDKVDYDEGKKMDHNTLIKIILFFCEYYKLVGFNVITTNNLFSFFSTVLRSHRKRAASPPVTLPHNHDPPPRTPPKSAAPEVSDLKNFILTHSMRQVSY